MHGSRQGRVCGLFHGSDRIRAVAVPSGRRLACSAGNMAGSNRILRNSPKDSLTWRPIETARSSTSIFSIRRRSRCTTSLVRIWGCGIVKTKMLIDSQNQDGCAAGSWNPERPRASCWSSHGHHPACTDAGSLLPILAAVPKKGNQERPAARMSRLAGFPRPA